MTVNLQDLIVPFTEEGIKRMTEKPRLRPGEYMGKVVSAKVKRDAEGYPVLSTRPKTSGCPELLVTIKPLANPEDLNSEVDVPVFTDVPLYMVTKRQDGSTVELSKLAFELCNGILSTFVPTLARLPRGATKEQMAAAIRATDEVTQQIVSGTLDLRDTVIFFTAWQNGDYINYKGFRRALRPGETLVDPSNMLL